MFDLKIELSPSQLSKVNSWLENFYSKCESRMSDPIVEGSFLKISSADIYNFLSAIEANEMSEFDLSRLRKSSLKCIQAAIVRKKDPILKKYYMDQLALMQ